MFAEKVVKEEGVIITFDKIHSERLAKAHNNRGFTNAIALTCYNRGNVYKEKGRYDQAISNYSGALKINPRYAHAYFGRGEAYYLKKEYDKSWDDINEAQNLGYQVPAEFLEELRKASGRED